VKTYGEIRFVAPDDAFFERGMWHVIASPDVLMRLKRLFPRADKDRSGWIMLGHTLEVARDLEWVLQRWPMKVSDDDRRRLSEATGEYVERLDLVESLLAGDRPHLPGTLTPVREPREYQLVAADLTLATGRLLLADELGLGKTMSGLLALRNPDLLPALIVCPTHLPHHWMRELAKTLPTLRAHIIRTGKPYDPAKRREMKGYDPDLLIVNYHKLRGWVDHLAGRVKTVIFDEAQELRRADSDKYKAAARIADLAHVRMGLTATPIYNYAGEIHNVLSVIAPDALGSREEFAREWGGATYWSDKLTVKDPKALGAHLRSEGIFLRRTRKEVGRELPEIVRVPHRVDADEQELDRLLEEGGAAALAETILHSGDRKEVFTASGEIDMQMRRATGVAKAPYVAAFIDMLLESEDKVVLFGWHRDVYEVWLERLADHRPVMFTGSESPAQKELARARFMGGEELDRAVDGLRRRGWSGSYQQFADATAESRVLIMSLRSGSGLDGLQDICKVGVFGELDWSPGIHDQCEGRYHRDGQSEPTVSYFLVSDVGSDPVVADVLNLKEQGSRPIVDPERPLFESADVSDRMRKLAESVLAKRRRNVAA
jgi:SNF2 domain-containing protein